MACHLELGQGDPLGLSHCQLMLGGTRIHVHTLPVDQVKRLFCHYLPILNVKKPWWPKGKQAVFLLIRAESLVIFKLKRVLLLPSNRSEFHPWEYSVWRTAGSKVQGKTLHYHLNHLVGDILPSSIPVKGLPDFQNVFRGKQTPTESTSLGVNFHKARWELMNAVCKLVDLRTPTNMSHIGITMHVVFACFCFYYNFISGFYFAL